MRKGVQFQPRVLANLYEASRAGRYEELGLKRPAFGQYCGHHRTGFHCLSYANVKRCDRARDRRLHGLADLAFERHLPLVDGGDPCAQFGQRRLFVKRRAGDQRLYVVDLARYLDAPLPKSRLFLLGGEKAFVISIQVDPGPISLRDPARSSACCVLTSSI